ncbi:hypothetical protein AT984_02730 [Paucibacter sp. KCTC 42545]|nr:hypothetical protein AT984_02730 [Paucibacter sp. KCTC 42545]
MVLVGTLVTVAAPSTVKVDKSVPSKGKAMAEFAPTIANSSAEVAKLMPKARLLGGMLIFELMFIT